MSLRSPRSIQIIEGAPQSADQLRIQIKLHADDSVVADATYSASPTGTTTIPIGSDGMMNNIVDGALIDIFIIEMKNGVSSTNGWQAAPGNPFTCVLLPDGAESITVTL